MEWFTKCLEQRYDPVSGYFRSVPGFNQTPDFRATELASMAVGNVIGYCRMLFDPDSAKLIAAQQLPAGADAITSDRVRQLLVRAIGLHTLATEQIRTHIKAEHEAKYGK